MSKELEALKIGIPKLKKLYENNAKKMSGNDIFGFDLTFSLLDKALQRLEYIDNSNPSEALENLIETIRMFGENQIGLDKFEERYNTIKNYILKAQEQEKVLNSIIEHLSFKDSGTEEYIDFITNQKVNKYMFEIESKDTGATIHIHLDTEEECKLLKRYICQNE